MRDHNVKDHSSFSELINMEIRPATESDADVLRRIAKRSWEHDYPGVVNRENLEDAVNEWYSPQRISAGLDHPETTLLVAEEDGDVIGFVHAYHDEDDDESHIMRLYVAPDRRRSAVATRLIDQICESLFEHSEQIRAMALERNAPAERLYLECGFAPDASHETNIDGTGYEENVYVLDRDDWNADRTAME